MKRILAFSIAISFMLLFAGCARVALRMSPPVVENMMRSIFEECDAQLARDAIPSDLKLLGGLAKTDPGNRTIHKALSMGFAGYGLLFLEDEDPERASGFYIRSKDHALLALGDKGELLKDTANQKGMSEVLGDMDRADLEALFWTAFSWNAWIHLNLDRPDAISQLGAAQACLERVLAMDSGYFWGLPAILQGAMLSARPQLLGGDKEKARGFFQKALEQSAGKFFPARYYYARYYAVAAQDKDLFRRLLQEVVKGEPGKLKEVCLINTVFQQKAARLLAKEDEFFF